MKRLLIILALAAFVLVPLATANTPPQPPHQFFGEVTINDQPAPAGTSITARVGGSVYGSTITTTPGEYGTGDRIFYVETADGQNFNGRSVAFYVDGELARTYAPYENGQSTQLDLSITREEETTTPPATGGGGGGGGVATAGGGGAALPPTTTGTDEEETTVNESEEVTPTAGECVPDWRCSEWTECVNNFQNRRCIDANQCGVDDDAPVERQTCGLDEVEVEEEPAGFLSNLFTGAVIGQGIGGLFGVLALLVIVAGLVGLAVWARKR